MCLNRSLFAGKAYNIARNADIPLSIECIRYFAGWADKITGNVIEVSCAFVTCHGASSLMYSKTTENKLTYTRHEPIGVVVSTTYINTFSLKRVCRDKSSPGIFPVCGNAVKSSLTDSRNT